MDQVVVVTGAAQGLGAVMANRFHGAGARVVLWDVQSTVKEVAESFDPQHQRTLAAVVDVTDEESVRHHMREAARHFGEVHVLVCNAKWNNRVPLADMAKEDWDKTLAVSLTGAFLCIKHGLPLMVAQGGGSIINMSSVHVRGAYPGFPAYDAAKGGIEALTRQVALDYGPFGVRCNAVAPGLVVADSHPDREALRARFVPFHPLGTLASPDDVAEAVMFLASAAARFVTGQCLVVDGGLTCQSPEVPGYGQS
ncbi:MAG: SDR family NAD(P)-dependent oxidoreductase [Thermaerobacter sp.]|nr:SDR family NAD(P)-dependent oxidoreductase [Thermaerobacter sp.]